MLRIALGIVAGALPALAYRATLDNPLIFDDRTAILLNPSLASPWDVGAVLLHDPAHPLVNLSYAIDRAISGPSSFGYHATNGILHLIVVGLLYGWCTRVLGSDAGQTGVRPGSDRGQTRVRRGSDPRLTPEWGAFFAAAIFAVHPLMGSTVGYAAARPELLGAVGFLASLTCARRAIVRGNQAAFALAVAFGVLAVASSRSAAALPLVVLAYDAWVLRAPGCRWRATRIYLPAAALVTLALSWHLRAALSADVVPPRGPIDNLLTESIVAWRYLALFLVPSGLSPVHDVHWVTGIADPAGLAAFAALGAAAALPFVLRQARPPAAFGLFWFVATLVPTTSLIPSRDAMSEARMYLPAAGLLLAIASVAARPFAERAILRAAGGIALAVLLLLTARRNREMADPVDLWRDVTNRAPGAWQAHLQYAESLREGGRCGEARAEYDAARRLNERLPPPHVRAPCESASPR